MLTNLNKKIELTANLAIIVVACLLASALVKNYLLTRPIEQTRNAPVVPSLTGKKLSSLNVDWNRNGQTLILAISTTCHFCSESASFYRQLSREHKGARLIAVLPQPVEEGTRYLEGLGVTVDDVRQEQLGSINVSGTPTLILADHDGVVTNTWVGKLAAQQEKEVLRTVLGAVIN